MSVNGSSGVFGSQGSLDRVSGAGSGSGRSRSASGATGAFGNRSVRPADPDPRLSMPKAAAGASASKAPRTVISDRSVSGIPHSDAAPSVKRALKHLATRAKAKATDKAAHLKEMVLSTPSSLKHLASKAVKKAKGENWKIVDEKKIEKLEDKALEGKLRRRNHLITERGRIKAEVRLEKSEAKQFQKKYGPSLALMEPGATAPDKGKFKMPGGFTVDFGKLETPEDKRTALNRLQESFSSYSKFQAFEEFKVSLEDREKLLADMKEELKELTAELKEDVEQYAPSQKEQAQARAVRQRRTSRQRLAQTREMAREEHFGKLDSLHGEVSNIKGSIHSLRARRTAISSVEVPRQEHALKELNRQRKRQLDTFRKEASNPDELRAMMEVASRHYQKSRGRNSGEYQCVETRAQSDTG